MTWHDQPRSVGVVLWSYHSDTEKQYAALKWKAVAGTVQDEATGIVYAWRIGSVYRDFTTPDKLAAGCRVSYHIDDKDIGFVIGLSWKGTTV